MECKAVHEPPPSMELLEMIDTHSSHGIPLSEMTLTATDRPVYNIAKEELEREVFHYYKRKESKKRD